MKKGNKIENPIPTTIFCLKGEKNELKFYAKQKSNEYFLFNQKFNRKVYHFYQKEVSVDKAISFKYGRTYDCIPMRKISERLPAQLKSAEKEYDTIILNQTQKAKKAVA